MTVNKPTQWTKGEIYAVIFHCRFGWWIELTIHAEPDISIRRPNNPAEYIGSAAQAHTELGTFLIQHANDY